MRLKKTIIKKIKQSALNSFGNVDIYLFGSRVDDTKKGGDIDLAIDSDISKEEFRRDKIKFISNLFRLDFDLKIDVVPYNTKDLLLYEQIHNYSIKLN